MKKISEAVKIVGKIIHFFPRTTHLKWHLMNNNGGKAVKYDRFMLLHFDRLVGKLHPIYHQVHFHFSSHKFDLIKPDLIWGRKGGQSLSGASMRIPDQPDSMK